MDAGLYVNLFEVNFEDKDVVIMQAPRSQHKKIKELRQQIKSEGIKADVYGTGDTVYGYGPEQNKLASYGFKPESMRIGQTPPLAGRIILDGYVESLKSAGYTCIWKFGRATAYWFGKALIETPRGVKLYRGFDLQSMFLFDPEADNLVYCVVVDAVFTYRDPNDKRINPRDVVARYGNDTLRLLRTKQGDLAPIGGINLEVSRQRLMELILPFVNTRNSFVLSCGIPAQLNLEPMRVVLAGSEHKQ